MSLQTLHDGWNPIQLKQSGSAVETRLYGTGLDEIYGRTNSGASQSTLTDALGSVLQLANDDQSAQADYTYGAYGQTIETPPGASSNLIRYTGREQDTAGLYYYRNRYYSTGTDRFISEDPIGLRGGVNLYSYVGGDPISAVDPMGLQYQGGLTARPFGVATNQGASNFFNNLGAHAPQMNSLPGEYPGVNYPWNPDPLGLPPPPGKPYCKVVCPDDGLQCKPLPPNAMQIVGNPACYTVCYETSLFSSTK